MNKPEYTVTVRGPLPAGIREKLVAGHVQVVKSSQRRQRITRKSTN